jgi:diguanylate cyclase (GGDEF)-like protein
MTCHVDPPGTARGIGPRGLQISEYLTDRVELRRLVFHLTRDVQDGVEMSTTEVEEIIQAAEARGWSDVTRAAMFLDVVRRKAASRRLETDAISRLLARAVADREPVMTALALAMGAQVATTQPDGSTVAGDRDLAHATVLLEGVRGEPLEVACAHIECAIAYEMRNLWELETDHFRAAEEQLRGDVEEFVLLPVIHFNRSELHMNWAMALREVGDLEALRHRALTARQALTEAEIPAMPASWRDELQVFADLLDAMAPLDQQLEGFAPPLPAEGAYAGYVLLARALRNADLISALAEATAAAAAIDPVACINAHSLAMCVCAEIESAIAGSGTAGLAYGRHLGKLRWRTRLASLASAESLLHAERLRSEHTVLSQHAYLDDLTRLGNRRALWRHLNRLVDEGVERIAILLLDLDHFKEINDRLGHGIGDQVLGRLAGLLRAATGVGDLAVRLGGDEFMLVISSAQPRVARSRADWLHRSVAAEPWGEIEPSLQLTISVGLAFGHPTDHEKLIAMADAALYRAKASGAGRAG